MEGKHVLGKELINGDAFAIKWAGKQAKLVINVVVDLGDNNYMLVDVNNPPYPLTYESIEQEVQSLEEIQEYLEFIVGSGQAEVLSLGNTSDEGVRGQIYFIMKKHHRKNEGNRLEKLDRCLATGMEKLKEQYLLLTEIKNFDFQDKDVIVTHSKTADEIVKRERVSCVGDEYIVLPTDRACKVQEDEAMTRDELNEYLLYLITEEDRYFSVMKESGNQKKKVYLPSNVQTKKTIVLG